MMENILIGLATMVACLLIQALLVLIAIRFYANNPQLVDAPTLSVTAAGVRKPHQLDSVHRGRVGGLLILQNRLSTHDHCLGYHDDRAPSSGKRREWCERSLCQSPLYLAYT